MISKYLNMLAVTAALVGCASSPVEPPVAPSYSVVFLDVARFDRELASSLNAKLPKVEVSFYEKVSPNAVPERLQKWINSVESSGGKLKVEPPPNEIAPKSPMALLSLLGTMVSGAKTLMALSNDTNVLAARGTDAVISLERNKSGEVVIGKIAFVQRTQ